MGDKIIFLSHIHEEKDLAILLKNAIELEFSGFVDVFVSTDGVSIPAGSNFLKRIENALIDCVGALFLISPQSVKRNWINFELGAVWIRNVHSTKEGCSEIPTIPICHSGITPSNLPLPLVNLNAISGNQVSSLESAFQSIQSAVGGKGKLKTNFNALITDIINFEQNYTIGSSLLKLMSMVKRSDTQNIVQRCEKLSSGERFNLFIQRLDMSRVKQIQQMEANELSGLITVSIGNTGTFSGPKGTMNYSDLKII